MSLGSWIAERIRRWEGRPADPSLLKPGQGSEAMIDADSPEEGSATAKTVRRNRDRRRRRWNGISR